MPVPPVVAVVVIHEPGDWLGETLAALAGQDCPGLQHLVLVTGSESDPGRRAVLDLVATNLPGAVVRLLGGNPGFAAACNRVLDLVEGESGFFCFLHDDVALAPDAISRLVEEGYRSNVGVAGPKLVYWDEVRMIQSVGTMVDRFGVGVAVADVGELDQEQHDAVRDVFALSGACLMVRADLFRAVGGFTADLAIHGADLDLCWRCHAAAARVVVVPAAVARHRESMLRDAPTDTRDDTLAATGPPLVDAEAESTRVRTVLSLTPAPQLPLLIAQLIAHTVIRSLILLFTGRVGPAGVEVRALLSSVVGLGGVIARRRHAAAVRRVSGAEVRALQLQGSAHVTSWLRARARAAGIAQAAGPVVREATPRAVVTLWVLLAVLLVAGSRSLITGGIAEVGQMARTEGGVRDLVSAHVSGWWSAGFGQASAVPTGVLLWAIGGVVSLGDLDVARMLFVVALPLVGWLGAWRLASVLGTRAARVAGTLAYAAVPLPYAAIASGRWGALAVYAGLPWIVHLSRLVVGHVDLGRAYLDAAGNRVVEVDRDLFVDAPPTRMRRHCAALALVASSVAAFEPGIVVVVPVTVAALWLATWVHGAPALRSLRWLGVGAGIVGSAAVLNLPWSATYVRSGWWEALTGAPVEGGRDLGLVALASFSVGRFLFAPLSIALYVAVAGAVFLVRGAKVPWALRGALLTGVNLLLVVLDDAALLPVHLPEPAVMLVPAALGISICAASMGAALSVDLRRGKFSWRQPLGLVVTAAFAVGTVPVATNAVDGGWNQPSLAVVQLMNQLPGEDVDGGYRTLFIGDPRVLPGAPNNLGWGIGWSVVNGRAPDVTEMWETGPTRARDQALVALYGIVRGQTARSGRLLAPLGVRYVVVPIIDGGESRRESPIAAPDGLEEALSRQLDLKRRYSSPDLVIFENASWIPVRSVLAAPTADASARAGAESVISADLAGAVPALHSEDPVASVTGDLPVGTFHAAVSFNDRWRLTGPDGRGIPMRPAFGLTNAWDITTAGRHMLSFDTGALQSAGVILQFAAWCVLAWLAVARGRRPRRLTSAPTATEQSAVMSMDQGREGVL